MKVVEPFIMMDETSSKDDILKSIYGPYYRLLELTGFFFSNRRDSKILKLISYLPMILIMGLLIARFLYTFIVFKKAESMTLLWCYTVPITFLALHNLLAAITVIIYRKKNYFPVLVELLMKASEKKIAPIGKKYHILLFIFMALFFYMSIMFIVENLVLYRVDFQDEKNLKKYQESWQQANLTKPLSFESYIKELNEENKHFRNLMFGGGVVFPLDIIIILIGTYMSTMVFAITSLSIRVLSQSYEKFNKEIKELKSRNQLNTFSDIFHIEDRFMDYSKLAKHVFHTNSTFISMTIMIGLIVHMSAQWGMRAYSEGMPALQMLVMINWTVLGLIAFVAMMVKCMNYYAHTSKTAEILLSEKAILGEDELKASYILDRITLKVERADYANHLLVPLKSSLYTIKALLFGLMFGIDIMAAYWKKIH